MRDNDTYTNEAPTRREYIKGGGAVVGGGLLAGCAGDEGPDSTPTDTATDEPTATATEDTSYSVTMDPVGTVEFDSVPETWLTWSTDYADIGFVLGQMDALAGMLRTDHWSKGNGGGALGFVNSLPGVEFDFSNLLQLVQGGEFDTEIFYEADADVHVMDPRGVAQSAGGEDEVEQVADRVGPFIGSRLRYQIGDIYGDDSRLYSLYEATEKVAEVFQQRDRYEAIKSLHDEFIADVQSRLPPESERPTVAAISSGSTADTVYPSRLYGDRMGTETKQYRDLQVEDVFEGMYPENQSYAAVDAEVLLDIDPDVIIGQDGILRYGTQEQFEDNLVKRLSEDDVTSQVTAVQNDEIHIGGTYYQGPIINLFQTEMLAKQLYPDEFGEYRGPFEVPEDEHLFDRQRVADIINGNF
jgi:iron complex transport system substrate-binding protein